MPCEHYIWRVRHTFGEPDMRICTDCGRVEVETSGRLTRKAWVAKALADSSALPREIRAQKVSVHDNAALKPKRPRPTTLAGRIAAPFWAFSRMVYGN